MESLANRKGSFTKSKSSKSSKSAVLVWPHPDTFIANPQTLSDAGFFFNPSKDDPDNVKCFICDKELGGWDEEDNPFEIHFKKCPKCPWAIARCSLEFDVDSKGNFFMRDSSRLPTNKALEKARLDTFGGKQKWWPHDAVKNHGASSKRMAKAGFVYTPQVPGDDTATCWYCDLSLSGWDVEDDPIEEHRKREERSGKSCPFFHAEIRQPTTSGRQDAKAKASSKKPRMTKQVEETIDDSENEKDATAGAPSKSKQKRTIQNRVASSSSQKAASSRKKSVKSSSAQDIDDDDMQEDVELKPAAGGVKSSKGKATEKAKAPTGSVLKEDEGEDEKPSETKLGRPKRETSQKPPSNVDGKVTKQYKDFSIDINDEGGRAGRIRSKGTEGTSRQRSKSKSRQTKTPSKPSSSQSRSRSHSRAPSRSRAPEIIDDEPPEGSKPRSRRQTSRAKKPVDSDSDAVYTIRTVENPESQRQTKSAGKQPSTMEEPTAGGHELNSKVGLAKSLGPLNSTSSPTSLNEHTKDFPEVDVVGTSNEPPKVVDIHDGMQVNEVSGDSADNTAVPVESKTNKEDGVTSRISTESSRPDKGHSPIKDFESQKHNAKTSAEVDGMDIDAVSVKPTSTRKSRPPTPERTVPAGGHVSIIKQVADTDLLPLSPLSPDHSKNPLSLFIPPLASAPVEFAKRLTEEERSMTVEDWIRHEMELQYRQLKLDGKRRIEEFKLAAMEVKQKIEML